MSHRLSDVVAENHLRSILVSVRDSYRPALTDEIIDKIVADLLQQSLYRREDLTEVVSHTIRAAINGI